MPAADAGKTALFRRRRPAPQRALMKMRTDRFALADLGQQDRLDEIVTDAARGLEDTFDVNGVDSEKGSSQKTENKAR